MTEEEQARKWVPVYRSEEVWVVYLLGAIALNFCAVTGLDRRCLSKEKNAFNSMKTYQFLIVLKFTIQSIKRVRCSKYSSKKNLNLSN